MMVEDDEVKREEDDDVEEEDRSQDLGPTLWREPAQSKCTWTLQKSHIA